MKKIVTVLLLLLLFPGFALASQIFGSLKEGDVSVGEGVEVRIDCDGKPFSGRTDAYGSYSIWVPRPGKCSLQVYRSGVWSLPFGIYSDERDPVRYDFELVREANGAISLRRR